jgi:5-methylcytosine-specific restriction endonuclease McrA
VSIALDIRPMVTARDKRRCRYRGIQCVSRKRFGDRDDSMTVGHVLPISAGGSSNAANLVTACRWCNQVKGDMVLSHKQFKQLEALALVGRGEEARQMLQGWKSKHVAMVKRR